MYFLEAACSWSRLFELIPKPIKPEGGSAATTYLIDGEVTIPFPEMAMTATTKLAL